MIDSDTFRAALGRFASGITVVTARDDAGRDHGMTVSAFCSVSLEPSYVLVSIGHDASMHGLMMSVEHVGISVLSNEQEALSRRFADPESDRFDGVGYARGEYGVALLDEALGAESLGVADRALAQYDAVRRREFGGKWIVEWLIGAVVASPRLMNRCARVLAARKDMADLLVGVTGDFVPASAVLNARYLASLFVLPLSRHAPRATRPAP